MTKAERHKIYKKALKRLQDNLGNWPFICSHIIRVTDKVSSFDDIPELFPELMTFKPKVITTGTTAWWPENDEGVKIRVNVLEKCILLTKPKSNGVSGRKRVSKRISISPRKKTNRRGATVVRRARKKSKTS